MKLYHGTTTLVAEEIRSNGLLAGSWLAALKGHALRLAERRAKQRGGEECLLEFDLDDKDLSRVYGRSEPTYRTKVGAKPTGELRLINL